jgi:Zn-dependent protease
VAARGWGHPRSAGLRDAFIPSWIFVLLVAVFVGAGVLAWQDIGSSGFDVFLFVVAGWLVSLSLHEYAHAILAYRGGDLSVAANGYLKLNLLRYAHPFLSIVLPVIILLLGGIGLPGGAVWIDRHAVRTRWGATLISLAGPGVNLVLAFALTVPFLLGVDLFAHFSFWAGVAFLAFLQLTAALLNVLPVPGLDGGNALRPWLNEPYDRFFDRAAPFGMLLLFALLFEPRINQLFFAVVAMFAGAFGLPFDLAMVGAGVFQFWR